MSASHEVMQAQRFHIVDDCFARAHHHRDNRRDESRLVREGHAHPFFGDRAGCLRRVPGQASKHIPVGLIEVRPAPVTVGADVGDSSHAGLPIALQGAVDHFADGGALALGVGVG